MFKEQQKLYKQGYKCVAGVDEAGRGPLAGPVVAAAVAAANLKTKNENGKITGKNLKLFKNLKDSKKLSEKQREEWYEILISHPDLGWAVAKVYPRVIDRINIFEATKLAMRRAVNKLGIRLFDYAQDKNWELGIGSIDCVIVDGSFSILKPQNYAEFGQPDVRRTSAAELRRTFYCKPIVKADETVFLCMAASVIAKVTRDRIMRRMHKKYPQYGFVQHKGYGTKKHMEAIKKYGPCEIHRKTFYPVSDFL